MCWVIPVLVLLTVALGYAGFRIGLFDRPQFEFREQLLWRRSSCCRGVTKETNEKTTKNGSTNEQDKNNKDGAESNSEKEVYVLIAKAQKPPDSAQYYCELVTALRESLDARMTNDERDTMLHRGGEHLSENEKCGYGLVAIYLNADTQKDGDGDDDDESTALGEETPNQQQGRRHPSKSVKKLSMVRGGSRSGGKDADTPDSGKLNPWGIGFAIGANCWKEVQDLATRLNSTCSETIIPVRLGGPCQPILTARIPWRSYGTMYSARWLHWPRAFRRYNAPDNLHDSCAGRSSVGDASVVLEAYHVTHDEKFLWIDYTIIMGNTKPIWDALVPLQKQ